MIIDVYIYGEEIIPVFIGSTPLDQIFSEESPKMAARNYHVRSNSLPTKPHPVLSQAEEHLSRLRASETATSSPSLVVNQKLSGLLHLHDSIDELLELTLTRQALIGECSEEKRTAADLLEGSVRVADLCGIARDLLVESKEFVQELQSILRRKGDIVSSDDLKNCLASRKMSKKAIRKSLKATESKKNQTKQEYSGVLGLLREAEAITLNAVERLLRSLGGCSQARSFSFVSKLVNSRRVDEEERHELQTVDLALSSIAGNKTIKEQDLQNVLDKLESSLGVVESLYRMLIRNRVSLLNVFNH